LKQKSKYSLIRFVYTNNITKIECCPFEQASDLVAVALESSIQIEGLKTKDQEVIEKCNIKGYQIGSKVTSLTWSPKSSSRIINGRFEATISLAASFEDNSIHVFLNNEVDDLTKHYRKRSLGWFNQICYDHTGDLLASIGDDKYCRIWNVTVENDMSEYPIEFKLEGKGVSVNFNQHSPGQFLTAEESGSIKLYDLDSKSVIRTLNSTQI
jgi:WD40 repeat protein